MGIIQIHTLRMRDGAWKTAEGLGENLAFTSGIWGGEEESQD